MLILFFVDNYTRFYSLTVLRCFCWKVAIFVASLLLHVVVAADVVVCTAHAHVLVVCQWPAAMTSRTVRRLS